MNIEKILSDAQGIYYQIKESRQSNDIIKLLLGLPITGNSFNDTHETSPFEENIGSCSGSNMQPQNSQESVRLSPDENSFDKCISSNFL